MHSQFLGTVFLALCLARGVLAAPLEITHDPVKTTGGVPSQEETNNLARLKTSETDANRHILKMEHVLNNPTEPKNAEMIQAAFGKNAKVDKIKNTVQTLKTGKLPVTLHTDPDPSLLAMVKYDTSTHPATSGTTTFGNDFHNKGTDNMRAATLVHEATHKLSNTGDTVDDKSKMIKGDDFKTKESGRTGYATHIEPATTVPQLNADPAWVENRDGAPGVTPIANLHKNAESYAQFGSLCDAAISNADVGLRRRAILEGDWHMAAVHLIRRQACAMRKPKGAAKTTETAPKTAKLTPAAKAKIAAVSKLTAKKPVGAAATAAAKKTAGKAVLPKGGLKKTPLSKTAAKSKIPIKSKSSVASSKLGKSRLPTPKTARSKKTTPSKKTSLTGSKKNTLAGSKTAARKGAGKSGIISKAKSQAKPSTKLAVKASAKKAIGVKTTTRKPVTGKTAARKPVTAKAAVRKPVNSKAAARKPVPAKAAARKPAAAKAAVRKPATKPAVRKPVAAKSAVRKPAAAKAAIRKPAAKPTVHKPVAAKSAVRKPVAAKAAGAKPAVRTPVAAKAAVRKPVAAKAVVAKAAPKPVIPKAAAKKVRRELDF